MVLVCNTVRCRRRTRWLVPPRLTRLSHSLRFTRLLTSLPMLLQALVVSRIGHRGNVRVPLSPTLIFEHPTALAIASHLLQGEERAGGVDLARAHQPKHRRGALSPSSHRRPGQLARNRSHSHQLQLFGTDCRWPGGTASGRTLWWLAAAAADTVGQVPPSRWAAADDAPSHLRTARFLSSVDGAAHLFDSACFELSSAEAQAADPQQRLLLEVGLNSFAISGWGRTQLSGTATAVLLAISNADWSQLQHQATGHVLDRTSAPTGARGAAALLNGASVYAATGGAPSVASGRLSFCLGLHGPCESVDSACSSSLVALHLATLHLRHGDGGRQIGAGTGAELAAALAASLVLAPHTSFTYARAGMLSVDGRCKTLDARANGYVRGEGVGAVVVGICDMRHRGQREGLASSTGAPATRTHSAYVCASAVRHDGTSASLTAPNGSAQAELLAQASGRASAAGGIGYVELHGTGTALGDPTEVRALHAALPRLCASAIKGSMGHLEPAAGMVGLHALLEALRRAVCAAHAQLRTLNPHLPSVVAERPLPVAPLACPASCAGVSSFGYSGTIAHTVVAAAAHSTSVESLTNRGRSPVGAAPAPGLYFRRRTFGFATASAGGARRIAGTIEQPTPFLGAPLPAVASAAEDAWEGPLSAHELAFLRDHRVGTVALLPGTCYIEVARALVRATHGKARAFDLSAVAFRTILFLDELDSSPDVSLALAGEHALHLIRIHSPPACPPTITGAYRACALER